jgi:hypothetical protein
MARITPASNVQVVSLEEDQPYKVTLKAIDIYNGEYKGKPQSKLQLDWEFDDSSSIRDWLYLKLGTSKGVPSKLRQLLNALQDRPALDEVSFFDDETYEWGYQGGSGPADNRLTAGMQVVIRGAEVQRQDGSRRWTIQKYQMVKRQKAAAAKPKLVVPVAPDKFLDPDDEDIPF